MENRNKKEAYATKPRAVKILHRSLPSYHPLRADPFNVVSFYFASLWRVSFFTSFCRRHSRICIRNNTFFSPFSAFSPFRIFQERRFPIRITFSFLCLSIVEFENNCFSRCVSVSLCCIDFFFPLQPENSYSLW